MGKSRAWQMFLAVVAVILGAELASAQQNERVCTTGPDGVRRCTVQTGGGGHGSQPGHGPRPGPNPGPRPGPHYPPPPPPNYPPPSYPPPPNYPPPSYPPPSYPPQQPGCSRAIQDFRQWESEAIRWDQEAQRTPYGSWEQRNAIDQRAGAIQRALDSIQRFGSLQGISFRELETFALQLQSSLDRSTYGSAMFNFYISARQSAWAAFIEETRNDIQQARDFREVEPLVIEFQQKLDRSTYGSVAFNSYRQVRDDMISTAVSLFQSQVRYVYPQELYQIQDQYNRLVQSSTYGSALFNYYVRIRDIARSAISGSPRPYYK